MAEYVDHGKIGGTAAMIISNGELYGKTIVDLWNEMKGKTEREDLSQVLRVQMGTATEAFNASWLELTSRYKVDRSAATGQLYTHSNGYSVAQIDGMASHPELDTDGLFEGKHTGQSSKMEDLCERYYPQIQHYMAVMNLPWTVLSIFFGNTRHQYKRIWRDEEYITDLMEREAAFWRYIVMDIEPPIPEKIVVKKSFTKKYDMEGNNQWAVEAGRYLESMDASKIFATADEALKDLMPADAGEASGHGILIKRSVSGGRRIWVLDQK
jgi:predicted phage-related endonuclease